MLWIREKRQIDTAINNMMILLPELINDLIAEASYSMRLNMLSGPYYSVFYTQTITGDRDF